MAFNLKRILRALLLSTSEPLSIKDIQAVITRYHDQAERVEDHDGEEPLPEDVVVNESPQQTIEGILAEVPTLLTSAQIREAMEAIRVDLEEKKEVIRLVKGASGYRITTAPDLAEWVRLLRNEPRPIRLRQAALETLAIVAYRQPVTRSEMETIRGVSVDSALSKLLELELVQVTGRAELPGRPIQYGTTDAFLDFVGVQGLEELPASDVLSAQQLGEWVREANQSDKKEISDKDMGLPEESPQRELFEDGDAEHSDEAIADELPAAVEAEASDASDEEEERLDV